MATVKFFKHYNQEIKAGDNLSPKEKEIMDKINQLLKERADVFDKFPGVFHLLINPDKVIMLEYSGAPLKPDTTIPMALFDMISWKVFPIKKGVFNMPFKPF